MSRYTMRNYAAMGDSKLLRCRDELANGQGDAYDRVIAKDGDPAEDLRAANAEVQRRGL